MRFESQRSQQRYGVHGLFFLAPRVYHNGGIGDKEKLDHNSFYCAAVCITIPNPAACSSDESILDLKTHQPPLFFSQTPVYHNSPRAVFPQAESSSQSSYTAPSPYSRPCLSPCIQATVGGQCSWRSYRDGCWRSIRILSCQRGRCRRSGLAAARAAVARGVCRPVLVMVREEYSIRKHCALTILMLERTDGLEVGVGPLLEVDVRE